MKKMFLVVIPFLMGCATTEGYKRLLNTWTGSHVDRLIQSWGVPRSSFKLSDGGEVLEYADSRQAQWGGFTTIVPQTTYHTGNASVFGAGGPVYGSYSDTSTTYVQKTSPVYNITLQCITRFTTDASGIIVNWSFRGNNCVAD